MTVRVCIKSMDDTMERIRIDLSLRDGGFPLQGIAYFGFYGAFGSPIDSGAILLTPDGIIDLGPAYEEGTRLHRTNLLQRKIELGQYVTIWWKWNGREHPTTFKVESVLDMTVLNNPVDVEVATSRHIESITALPQFRTRVRKSFNIEGYDGVVYRPPIGIEGYAAIFEGDLYFCPDNAFDKTGKRIIAPVESACLELIQPALEE